MTRQPLHRARHDVALLILVLLGALAPIAVHAAGTVQRGERTTHDAPTRHPDVRAGNVGAQLVAAQPTKPRPQSGLGIAGAFMIATIAAIRPRDRRRRAAPARNANHFALRRGPPLLHTV
jgi:hypothetical protein